MSLGFTPITMEVARHRYEDELLRTEKDRLIRSASVDTHTVGGLRQRIGAAVVAVGERIQGRRRLAQQELFIPARLRLGR